MVVLIWLVACTDGGKDSGDSGEPTVTLASGTQFIFDRNCAFSGCHLTDDPVVGDEFTVTLNLSAASAWSNLVNVDSEEVPSMKRVVPGDPDASYFWHKVNNTHLDVGGIGTRMPPELLLADSDRTIIEAWILAGALQ